MQTSNWPDFVLVGQDVVMSGSRRKFTSEYKVEAAHRVIDSGRSIAEVAQELGIMEQSLGAWFGDERCRIQAAKGAGLDLLSGAEPAELVELRELVAEQEKDRAFLGKTAAYFASKPPRRSDSR